ncbi:MAG: methylated-DNA--[protein]-cysteine S-methyltransferase [Myxococcales bacterium]
MLAMLSALPSDCVRSELDSPVGTLSILASNEGLHAILWPIDQREVASIPRDDGHPVVQETVRQLLEYFAKTRTRFELPVVWDGTPFQVRAWRELARIPYGETITYQEQARRMGDERKARAVGGANGRNPISIVVPCHRVIAKDGSLAGFGGGVEQKKLLIEMERSPRADPRPGLVAG